MNDSVRLGRVAGIPIGMNWSILVMAVAVSALLSIQVLPSLYPDAALTERVLASGMGALLFFVSVLGHELGHALIARRHHVGVIGITLWVLGGVAKLDHQPPTPRAEFQIAIAGPLASFVIGLGFAGAATGLSVGTDATLPPAVLAWLAAVNLLLAVSNLLPGAPLDGGRVLTALLWKRTGNAERARLLSARSGFVLGLALMAFGMAEAGYFDRRGGWWTVIIGAFILTAARAEITAAAVRLRLGGTRVADLMSRHPRAVLDSLSIDQVFGPGRAENMMGLPIVRWDHNPIGYISVSMAREIDPAQRSWTTVGDLMCPTDEVARAWSGETVQNVIDRAEGNVDHVTVVHESQSGMPIGTVSRMQMETLLAPPDFWGRDRPQPPAQAPDLVFGGADRR